MVTTALEAGVAPHVVQRYARHVDLASTLDYDAPRQAMGVHPGVGLGAIAPSLATAASSVKPHEERVDESGGGLPEVPEP